MKAKTRLRYSYAVNPVHPCLNSDFLLNRTPRIQHSTNKSARIFSGDFQIFLSACQCDRYGGKVFAAESTNAGLMAFPTFPERANRLSRNDLQRNLAGWGA